MAYEVKPINEQRKENNSTIDTMCGIELIGNNNKHRNIPAHIDIPKPYFRHDIPKGKTYFIGKNGVIPYTKLCDVIKNALNGNDSPESFKDAVCIEFCLEDEKDVAAKTRAMEFYDKIRAVLATHNDFPVKFFMESWPASNMTEYKNYPYSEYLIFKPDTEKGMNRLKIKIQK